MADPLANYNLGATNPAGKLVAITPNDGADLATVSRGLWVGTGGNIAIIAADDSAAVTISNVADGTLLPIRAKRVNSTNTTASNIVALI